MENVTIGLAFIAGLLSFVSPCCLPLVPAYIGYMSGRLTHTVALQTTTGNKPAPLSGGKAVLRAGMLLHGLAFVAGFTLVFVALGVMTTAFVSVLGGTVTMLKDIIAQVGGVLIIVFGLHFMGALRALFRYAKHNPGVLNIVTSMFMALAGSTLMLWGFIELPLALPFLAGFLLLLVMGGAFASPREFWLNLISWLETLLYSDTRGQMTGGRGGLAGSFTMGLIFSAGWTPCIGPMLGTILTLAAETGEAGAAVPLLTAYSLGLGIPFLLAALLLDGSQKILRRIQRHVHKIEFFSGVLLVIIGILVATRQLALLSQNLSGQFADFSYRVEECGVGFFTGRLPLHQVGPCLNGTLEPLALNQSAAGKVTADAPRMEYVFHLESAMAVDVQLSNLDMPYGLSAVLYNSDGELLAQSSNFSLLEEKVYLALTGVLLEPGRYTLVVSQTGLEKTTFRIKIREAQPVQPPVSVIVPGAAGEDSPILDLALEGINTITGAAAASPPAEGTGIGERAPDFTLRSDTGESVTLADLRGKIVLLNFWGTWCGPCRREMSEFQALYEQYGPQNFTILAVAVRDTPKAVRQFRHEFGLTFTLALDEDQRVNDLFRIPGQPATLILDKEGVIRFQSFSVVMKDQLEPVLKSLLSG